jgi:PadR family transcriptional regulator, regulatory protein PadR
MRSLIYIDSRTIVIRMSNQEMREPTFFVLASLADGRKHGYGIIKDAEELSDGRVSLKVGTLYAALERLQAEGLVTAAGDEVVGGRLRRYFELTEPGAASLAEESERQELNAKRARDRLKSRAARVASSIRTATA